MLEPSLKATHLSRWLASAQQLKDTLTILGMHILFVFGLLFGIGIPGLILYFLRWRIVRGNSSPQRTQVLWCLGFVHEFLCVLLFQSAEIKTELHETAEWVSIGYMIGLGISLTGLIEAFYTAQRDTDAL